MSEKSWRLLRRLCGFGGAYALYLWLRSKDGSFGNGIHLWYDHRFHPFRADVEGAAIITRVLVDTVHQMGQQLDGVYGPALVVATILTGAGLVARKLTRGPIVALRARMARHAGLARAAAWLPGLFVAWDAIRHTDGPDGAELYLPFISGLAVIPIALAITAVTRLGLRALVAPLPSEAEAAAPADPEEIAFSAVAVTPRTLAAVGGLALASLATAVYLVSVTEHQLRHGALPVLAAYVAAAVGATAVLRRASRIAVGIDGVLVRGATKTTFYAYADLDGARAHGADIDLVQRGKVVLRLQMHSEDAGRQAEVIARIEGAVARARETDTRAAQTIVTTSSSRDVAGAADYRRAALSREQLWELVEGANADASARTAAAEALALSWPAIDHDDRARLRVAAEQCAEPCVRVALQRLADDDADDVDEPAAELRSAARS